MPVPKAEDIAALNRQLLAACRNDEHRTIAGRPQSIGAALIVDGNICLPLAPEGMDLAHTTFPTVNSLGCAKGSHQCVLGAAESRNAGAGKSLRQHRRALA